MRAILFKSAGIALLSLLAPIFSPAAETVIFSENFQGATENQQWAGYNRWTGSDTPIIRRIADAGMMGFFPKNPSEASMKFSLAQEYPLQEGAYRLTFDIRGSISRSFQVMLSDPSGRRIGLQLGHDAKQTNQITGASIDTKGHRTLYLEGGFTDLNTMPAGFSKETFYQCAIVINGTSEVVRIGENEIAPATIRVTFNSRSTGDLKPLSMEFPLPYEFRIISGICVVKAVGTTATWAIGNFEFSRIQ